MRGAATEQANAPAEHSRSGPVLALCGGVGGAKLALGLYRVLPPGGLTVLVNTGDDFEHLGLHIAPDLDTVMYTLAGVANAEKGWGRANETWTFMAALEAFGGETWFRLGDGDLATHVERTRRLQEGEALSAVTADLADRLGVQALLLPMSDAPVRTFVRTDAGELPFQTYFVRLGCAPRVIGVAYHGAEHAAPPRAFHAAVRDPDLQAAVICPSNPYLSIGPILAVAGVREALRACRAPVVAVSPIVAGQAIKGPTAKIMEELGVGATPAAVAEFYGDVLDVFVIDEEDAGLAGHLPVPTVAARTVMHSLRDREQLARAVLAAAREHTQQSSIERR
jgi:LPPG:FO 2-phospho-L-lactate transferase